MSWTQKISQCGLYMGRVVPEVDPRLAKHIAQNEVDLKKLVTRRKYGLTPLPARLELAAEARIKRYADTEFRAQAKELLKLFYKQDRPDDRTSIEVKKADIKTEFELRDKIFLRSDYEPDKLTLTEEQKVAQSQLSRMISGKLDERTWTWRYYNYDTYSCNLYMATRLAPNYASIKTVLNEIHDLVPEFQPKSVLDYGSGMGTTIWAVNETWPKSVNEFMNIDLAVEQHYLCEFLLRGGKESGPPLQGIFQRQYLPASNKAKYDLVVAAYTLLELPNLELRTSAIESLWNKTNDILVLIERGNHGGFTVIDEARNLILGLEGHNPVDKLHLSGGKRLMRRLNPIEAHVVAPCCHEFRCPRNTMPIKRNLNVCNFRVTYEPLNLGEKKGGFHDEFFSYVVIRKKPSPNLQEDGNIRWPRVVEPKRKGSRHLTFKLCCPNGNLAETTVTQKKYGKEAYKLAKSCNWGSILPVKVVDSYSSKKSFNNVQSESYDKRHVFMLDDNK